MPESIDIQVKNVQSKLLLLLKKHSRLLKELELLKKENEAYKEKERSLTERALQLEQQVNILKASAGKMEGKDKADFEKGINRYIKYIDKCIAVLNK